VQVDSIKPMLNLPGTEHLKLKRDVLLSSFAFKFTLRRYTEAQQAALRAAAAAAAAKHARQLSETKGWAKETVTKPRHPPHVIPPSTSIE